MVIISTANGENDVARQVFEDGFQLIFGPEHKLVTFSADVVPNLCAHFRPKQQYNYLVRTNS